MKKLFFVVLTFGLFLGCEATIYSVSITNNSSRTVSFIYDGHPDTLAPSEYRIHHVLAHTQPPKDVVDQNGIASIRMTNSQGEIFKFWDAEYLNLNVINTLPIDITIKAGNFIDNNGSMELFIERNEEATARIYSRRPVFTTTSNYPVIFYWNITENEISVIIR